MSYINAQVITEIIMSARSGKIDLVDMKVQLRSVFEKERERNSIFSPAISGQLGLGELPLLSFLFLKILELNVGKTRPYSRAAFQVFKDEINIFQTYNKDYDYFLTNVLRRFLEANNQLRDLEMDNEHSNEVLLFVMNTGLVRLEQINITNLRIFNPTIVSFAKL